MNPGCFENKAAGFRDLLVSECLALVALFPDPNFCRMVVRGAELRFNLDLWRCALKRAVPGVQEQRAIPWPLPKLQRTRTHTQTQRDRHRRTDGLRSPEHAALSEWMARPVSAVIVAWRLAFGAAGLLAVHGTGRLSGGPGFLPKQSMRRSASSVPWILIRKPHCLVLGISISKAPELWLWTTVQQTQKALNPRQMPGY